MSYRDELIEIAAQAIALTDYGDGHDKPYEPYLCHAEAALDALLNKLEQPSEEMLSATGVHSKMQPDFALKFRNALQPLKGNSND